MNARSLPPLLLTAALAGCLTGPPVAEDDAEELVAPPVEPELWSNGTVELELSWDSGTAVGVLGVVEPPPNCLYVRSAAPVVIGDGQRATLSLRWSPETPLLERLTVQAERWSRGASHLNETTGPSPLSMELPRVGLATRDQLVVWVMGPREPAPHPHVKQVVTVDYAFPFPLGQGRPTAHVGSCGF